MVRGCECVSLLCGARIRASVCGTWLRDRFSLLCDTLSELLGLLRRCVSRVYVSLYILWKLRTVGCFNASFRDCLVCTFPENGYIWIPSLEAWYLRLLRRDLQKLPRCTHQTESEVPGFWARCLCALSLDAWCHI